MINKQPINTAILAYGMSGEVFHAPLISAHPGFSLRKIMERSSDKAVKRYPGVETVRKMEDILSDASIELVIVNTPHDLHYEHARQVIEAQKHLVIEKPFSTTLEEGSQLTALAKKHDVKLSIFQNRRWDGDFMTVQRVVSSGLLGPIVEFEAHYDRYRPVVDTKTWKERAGKGAGSLFNLGPHMIDQALVLFGMPERLDSRLMVQRPGGSAEDFYDIRMIYSSGLHVILKSSYLVREPGPRYVLHGVNGSFVKYGLDPQEQALKDRVTPGSTGWGVEPRHDWGKINTNYPGDLAVSGEVETIPGNYLLFYENIYAAIRDGAPLAVTPEQAMDIQCVMDACIESNSKGVSVKVQR